MSRRGLKPGRHIGAEVCKYYGLQVTDLHFLRKPFNEAKFLAAVKKVLQADIKLPTHHQPKVQFGQLAEPFVTQRVAVSAQVSHGHGVNRGRDI